MALDLNEAIQILTLANALAPAGIKLVKDLATSLQGKTDEQINAEADALDQKTIATADKELAQG